MTRYQHLATLLAQRIHQGLYRPGERLPSVRVLSQEHGVSISTVQQAYHRLEEQMLISPQPRSGYFVSARYASPPVPAITRPAQRPVEITHWDAVRGLLDVRKESDVMQLGSGMPDVTSTSLKPLWKIISRQGMKQDASLLQYGGLLGVTALREQIARLAVDGGCRLSADEIVTTTGCQEALFLCLRAVCEPGDIIAVESPTFYGMMQTLRSYGVKVIEIPTDSVNGLSLEALELALDQWPIKAVFVVPNCNNPLGFIMPEARKRGLMTLAQRFDIAIIEDDVYGELAYEYPRPTTLKSLDDDGRVLLCSSFSKVMAPGLRVGWVAPGRYFDRVLHMKYVNSGGGVIQTQAVVAEFIHQGHYLPHLRRMRTQYQRNQCRFTSFVRHYFPEGLCVSRPQGGFLMWIELPEAFDGIRLNRRLAERDTQVAVGSLFSASGKYRNCVRLNYALPCTEETERALKMIGEEIAQEMVLACKA
ncbi:PLP-dependent aminotransferase family protein [Lonsdalea quercina]|uniref:aminotransferase-like domain-containing protein n=1 Tax=Lonsdalea quercina TaxID=71657 RepID=UPI003974C0F1